MRALVLAALLPLAGCGAVLARDARQAILGMTAPDLLACAGVPNKDKIQRLDDRELMIEYDYSPPAGALFNLQVMTDLTLAVGQKGACNAHFRILRDGTVAGVSFSGTSFSFSGPYADCAPLIRECVNHPDRTKLPPGYDAFAVLLPEDKAIKPPSTNPGR